MSYDLEEYYQRAFWPDLPRKVFEAGPARHNASFGATDEAGGFLTRLRYRDSYEEAVEVLFKHVIRAEHPEKVVLPLAFMWRHLIEIALKDVVRCSRELFFEELSDSEQKVLRSHDLLALWQTCKVHLGLLGSMDDPTLLHVEGIIRELHEVDPTADGFRYPFKRDGQTKNLTNAPDQVDIVQMHQTLAGAFNFLGACLSEIDRRDDFFGDYEREMAKEFGWPDAEELGKARRAYCEQQPAARVVEHEGP